MTLVVVSKNNTHAMTLVDLCVVCERNKHAMTLGVVHEKNTDPMTLVDPYVVLEKNTPSMTLVTLVENCLSVEHIFCYQWRIWNAPLLLRH